jgi:hypothetical protein
VKFSIERLRINEPATVYITIVDGCGEWRTFVGDGVNAW